MRTAKRERRRRLCGRPARRSGATASGVGRTVAPGLRAKRATKNIRQNEKIGWRWANFQLPVHCGVAVGEFSIAHALGGGGRIFIRSYIGSGGVISFGGAVAGVVEVVVVFVHAEVVAVCVAGPAAGIGRCARAVRIGLLVAHGAGQPVDCAVVFTLAA